MTPPTDGAASGAGPMPPDRPDPAAEPTASVEPAAAGETAPDAARPAPGPVTHPVQYRGQDLDPERGPGLGCFRFQIVVLVFLLVLTPVGVNAGWPDWLTAALLFVTLGILLVAGQTIIFLLRLVAADRRSRRRPLASRTPTVGELVADGAPRVGADGATPGGATLGEDSGPGDGTGGDPT